MKRFFLGIAAASALGFNAAQAETWDMPAAYAAGNHISKSYIAFAEDVTANSGGDLEIIVHPAGSLYAGAEILRAVRSGQVPIGGRYMGAHAKEHPIFGLDTVPFLATDMEQAWKLYQASKPAIEAALEERGMKLLYTAPWPAQGLFSKTEVNSLDDMKGVKFRAYDASTSRLAALMGAVPTSTEASEISQAFSTGVADSMIGSGAIGVFQKLWDYVDYFYKVNAWIPKSAVVVNKAAFDGLSEDTQAVVMQAAAKAEADVWATVDDIAEEYNNVLAENGMKVLKPSEALANGFADVGKTMADEWAEEAGDAGAVVIEAYRAN
ncbi:TRAP transporter substrate-binding protein [Oceanibium sediminis]|uniref:TRAP transporter substrate-binding protein n=1 Tax=Oceanibium sediminis TaxID=2026339 RepID=UPI000DD342EC|nr:TRAP transporter substrate-binding protein [Oceanibium sediminis]